MPSKPSNDFVTYMHIQMGLNLDTTLDWTPLVQCLDGIPALEWTSRESLRTTLDRIEEHKSKESRTDAVNHKTVYDLFLGRLLEAMLKDPVELTRHYQCMPTLMRTWTNQGSAPIDEHLIQTIGPLYRQAILHHRSPSGSQFSRHVLMLSVYHGPQLWPHVKDIVLPDLLELLTTHPVKSLRKSHITTSDYKLLHRFEPELVDYSPDQQYTAYADLCGLHEEQFLEPSQIQTILTGAHHNPAAWLMAIDLCMEENYKRYVNDPEGFALQWNVIEDRLSTLVFDPTTKPSWALWMLLDTRRHDSPIIESVYTTLSQIHTEMHQAYSTYWPLVSGMFEDEEEQQDMAAQYYRESQQPASTTDAITMEFES